MSNVIIYTTEDGAAKIELRLENGTVWLSQAEIAELFQTTKQNISKHIQAIFGDQELDETATVNQQLIVQNEGDREVSRAISFYNLDVILAVGYRVRSVRGVQFRRYASTVLKEYLEKGFALNDERLKNLGGGNYWKELLDRIRDIRSSEKVMYRQVLELYATAIDYDPKSDESLTFFKMVQNKLHFAAHGKTASEIIYFRVDSDKPFAGLTNFKGSRPTQAEAMVAKNYLSEQELKVLNNIVSAYFDFAELNAIEEREMRMADFVRELDRILSSAGRKLLENAGTIRIPESDWSPGTSSEVRKPEKAEQEMSSVNFLEKLLDGVEVECVSSKPLNTRNTRKSKNLKILSVFSMYSVVNPELEFAV